MTNINVKAAAAKYDNGFKDRIASEKNSLIVGRGIDVIDGAVNSFESGDPASFIDTLYDAFAEVYFLGLRHGAETLIEGARNGALDELDG
jgi:hypothetical protein